MKHYQKAALAVGLGAAAAAATGVGASVVAIKQTLGRANSLPSAMPEGAWVEYGPRLKDAAERLIAEYPPETIRITSEDGLTLCGKLLTPPYADKLAICVHGYHSTALTDFGGIAWYYIRRGWQVLLVDDRAHGDSEGNIVGFGTLDRRDVLQWLRYCNIRFGKDYPIILHGVSMGAATVLMATGLALPENVRAVVGDCGFTSAWEEFDHVLRAQYGPLTTPCLHIADAWARRNAGYALRECSAAEELEHATVPVMFIHGTADTFVPPWMTEKNYEACPTFKMKYLCEDAGHAESWFKDEQAYSDKLDAFYTAVGVYGEE